MITPLRLNPWVGILLLCFCVVCFDVLYCRMEFGSLSNYKAYLKGNDVAITPTSINVNNVAAGNKISLHVDMRNLLSHRLTVTGFRAGCGCLTCPDLPRVIDADSSCRLDLMLDIPTAYPIGSYVQKAIFFIDNGVWTDYVAVAYRIEPDPKAP